MKMKRSILATALMAGFALGSAAPAVASVYGGSQLSISNLQINFIDQSNNTPITNINPNFTFNVEDSATLNGAAESFSAGCNSIQANCGANPVLTVPAANAPGSDFDRADTDYSLFGPGSGTYANSNAEITDSQLIGDPATQTQQVAEAELDDSGQAQASTNIQSNTTFTLDFTINPGTGPARLEINFNANPEMQALVNTLGLGLAQSNLAATFSLTGTGGTPGSADWSPDGQAATATCGGGLVCSNEIDPEDLNLTLGAGPGNSNSTHSLGTGPSAFQLHISGLVAGDYSLTLAALTSVSVTQEIQQIPEPTTLMLLGSGLMALGFAGTRRRRQQRLNAA